MRTREENRIHQLKYRAKYRDKVRAYDRMRYKARRAEQNRIKAMGEKKCRVCEIMLRSRYGGFGTKHYCRSCVERGLAQRHSVREAMRRFRLKQKQNEQRK